MFDAKYDVRSEVVSEKITLTLHREEWEYILAACEDLSCGYPRTDFIPHCCDLNEVVPKVRRLLGIPTTDDGDN